MQRKAPEPEEAVLSQGIEGSTSRQEKEEEEILDFSGIEVGTEMDLPVFKSFYWNG